MRNAGCGRQDPAGATAGHRGGCGSASRNRFTARVTRAIPPAGASVHGQRSRTLGSEASCSIEPQLAVVSGKGLSFPQPAGTGQDYGTDGGAHNFLRYLENWGGFALNYRGSIVSLFQSRQANGTYKCCADVYSPPVRGYAFDTEFLTPALLPPKTPMFRDINATGFAQLIRPR